MFISSLIKQYCLFFAIAGLCCFFISHSIYAQQSDKPIRLNQVGFYPGAPKIAVVSEEASGRFYLTSPDKADTLYTGELSAAHKSAFSEKTTRIADFSDFKAKGEYVVAIPSLGTSYPFFIKPRAHQDVVKAALKGFYFQRASTALPEAYAEQWKRPAAHPDRKIVIHASAATDRRPKGSTISSPGGWYDAGDYNKYIVNSGITIGTLLSAYEDFSSYFDTLKVSIPEGHDSIPDILNEVLWNLRWMLSMQDTDGGVYHKLTTASFEGMNVRPSQAKNTRYVVQKSTAATLDFAAVMAQAGRVFSEFSQQLPGLSDSCLLAATNAWRWAKAHPKQLYKQEEMNKKYQPAISTGAYGDQEIEDEWGWAAAELYVTTRDSIYLQAVEALSEKAMMLPSWSKVGMLGCYTLLRFEQRLPAEVRSRISALKGYLIDFADELTEGLGDRAYRTVMGRFEKDFVWGSNAVAANQGVALLQAYRFTSEIKYVDYALSNLDYLLGRNATGYCFVTGFGEKSPLYPHHRPSESDEVTAPIPGLLVGGPNPGQQDKCQYSSAIADESYVDHACSYASNEIAINWNAPLVYLAAALEALQHEVGYTH